MGITGYHNFSSQVCPLPLRSKIRPQTFVEKIPHIVTFGEKPTPQITSIDKTYTSSPKVLKTIFRNSGNSPDNGTFSRDSDS